MKKLERETKATLIRIVGYQHNVIEDQKKEIALLKDRIEELNPSSYYTHFSQRGGIPGCSCD